MRSASVQAEEIVRIFQARGRGPKYRAKCPVHKSRGLTLSLKAGEDRMNITCFAGCSSDDVLEAVGLTWKDTLYRQQEKLSPQAYREAQRARRVEEEERAQERRRTRYWVNEVRKWEAVENLLAAHLAQDPENRVIDRLWRRSLATARERLEKLREHWPNAPELCCWQAIHLNRELTRKFVGDEIAEILGL